MKRAYNFNAGPSMLPREVVEATASAVLDYDGMGLSLMELSHRSAEFKPILDEARRLLKELLDVPAGYEVLFLGGDVVLEGHIVVAVGGVGAVDVKGEILRVRIV